MVHKVRFKGLGIAGLVLGIVGGVVSVTAISISAASLIIAKKIEKA